MEKELKFNIKKLSAQSQEELRKKILREMEKCGGSKKEAGEICECSIRHAENTRKKYQKKGISGIMAVKMGRAIGRCRKLNARQEEAIKKVITEKTPEEAGVYLPCKSLTGDQ